MCNLICFPHSDDSLYLSCKTSTRTQLESIENFLDENHVGRLLELLWGGVTVPTDALQIANVLSVKVNNTLDVYSQSTQNSDGGFGNTPDLNTTVATVRGLSYLSVNWSQLHNWEIFGYYNICTLRLLYENVSKTT